jgi:putative drug exporter of the RND superfamily
LQVALLVELVILVLYLRAVVAPVVLLACSLLSVAAALGIPLATFRQIAFAMTVGMLIDTMVVRPVLTPAVLTLLGRAASWPSHRITTDELRLPATAATSH